VVDGNVQKKWDTCLEEENIQNIPLRPLRLKKEGRQPIAERLRVVTPHWNFQSAISDVAARRSVAYLKQQNLLMAQYPPCLLFTIYFSLWIE
jgi:hypothetical protein